jgi:hypothetical protein
MKGLRDLWRLIPCGRCILFMVPATAMGCLAFLFCERYLQLNSLPLSIAIQGLAVGTTLVGTNYLYTASKASTARDSAAMTLSLILDTYSTKPTAPASIVIDPRRVKDMKKYLFTQVDPSLVDAFDDCVSSDGHVVWRQIGTRIEQLKTIQTKLSEPRAT